MSVEQIERQVGKGTVRGGCDPRFQPVLEAFVENFESRGEVGASVCLKIGDETLVDLWGGHKTADGAETWDEDTVSIVFSCTKGATALCAHMLIDRGQLDLNAPVKDYWPEFAQNGKEETTVAMMLDHSAGVAHVRERLKDGAYADWDYMVATLEKEEPFWHPGTRNGYHGVTFAWTVGELVRRVSGKPLGEFFRDEVAGPLGLDFWIGLPEEKEPRVSLMIEPVPDPDAPVSRFTQAVLTDPTSLSHLFLVNSGGAGFFSSREMRAADIGSANGVTNARGLAGMYAPLAAGGTLGDVALVSPDVLERMGRVATATHEDATLLIPTRFALGYMKSMDNRYLPVSDGSSMILSDAAFGHVGMGGSIGFADPQAGFSFAYTMNRMGTGILLNERGQAVVDAAYQAMGFGSNRSGVWRK